MNKEQYFITFADCKVTKGAQRASIVDLSRSKIYLVSNELADLLEQLAKEPFDHIVSQLDKDETEAFIDVIQYLEQNELGFFTSEPEQFPVLPDQFDYPALISNCMIDIEDHDHDFDIILPQLVELGCYDLQLRIFSIKTDEEVERMMAKINSNAIKSVELFLHHETSITKKFLRELTEKYFKIRTIYVHSAPKDEAYIIYPERYRNNMGNIIFLKQEIKDESHCGFISPKYFTYDNAFFYNESKKVNNCLSRKLGIDKKGKVKNCPALAESFGQYDDKPLREIAITDSFQAKWNITKDQIDTCNSCEFRYVCTDCRAYTEGNQSLGKPIKCGYDPKTLSWSNKKQEELLVQKL